MFPDSAQIANQAVRALQTALRENLYSCSLYGSTVRGNAVAGISDVNLLVVLRESSPAAHEAIAEALSSFPAVDPFILCLAGLDRTIRSFAGKFASIQRNYQLLHGEDILGRIQIEPELLRFLCEQALRNLRLRLVYAFVTRKQHKAYDRFLRRSVPTIFVQCSEVLRLSGTSVPKEFEARVPLLAKQFGIDGQVLRDLLVLKLTAPKLSDSEMKAWHRRVIPLLDQTLGWIEKNWMTEKSP